MTKEELLKQLNDFLDNSPLSQDEVDFWQEKSLEMDEAKLSELLVVLKERVNVLEDANHLFIKINDDAIKERDKAVAVVPQKVDIFDLPIRELTEVFEKRLKVVLEEKGEGELISGLHRYFSEEATLGRSAVSEADLLVKALLNNLEILFTEDEATKKIGIRDWLIAYNNYSDKLIRRGLDRLNFVNQDALGRKLNQGERGLLLKLLKLFDALLDPSQLESDILPQNQTPISVKQPLSKPQPVLKPMTVIPPAPVSVSQPKPRFTQDQIMQKYQGDPREDQAIKNRAAQLDGSTQGDFGKIRDAFYLLLSAKPEKVETVAILYLLAQKELLDDVLKDDSRFYRLVEEELTKTGKSGSLNDFKMYPTAPQFIQLFLEIILVKKLNLKENEGARIALHLGNILRQAGNDKYGKMAYFDMQNGDFRWNK